MISKHYRHKKKIVVFWMTQNYDLIQNEMFPYVINLQLDNDWKRVRLVLCEPSIKLIALDQELKENLKDLRRTGIELQACISHNYSNIQSIVLADLGIKEVYMRDPFREYKKANWAVLFF